jgi:sugar lactone lactonase YvrE
MTKDRRPRIPRSQIRQAYKRDLAEAWNHFLQSHPECTPYAFVLYGVEGGIPRLWPVVLTEEGLSRVAKHYVKIGVHDTLGESLKELRYAVADAPHLMELLNRIPTVDAIVKPFINRLGETAGYEILAEAAMDALGQLDGEGFFGRGAKRTSVLLFIYTDDTEDNWVYSSARLLNPKTVFNKFERETRIKGSYASCHAVAIARDGHSIYSVGSRKSRSEREESDSEFVQEIVAYNCRKGRISRRWTYPFPGDGDSGRAIAEESDGKSIVVLRAQYEGSDVQCLLMRFGALSRRPIYQAHFPGEPTKFAFGGKGSKIAVAMSNKTLKLLDSDFRIVASRRLSHAPRGLCFLRSGDLLATTGSGIQRLDGRTLELKSRYRVPANRLVTADSERLMAVSQWFPKHRLGSVEEREFGVQLLRLPSFEKIKEFVIPGCQAVTIALSPDGARLAFEARVIGKHKRFVVIFDTKSGQEIARRKSMFIHELAFLRDSRSLAIPKSGFMTKEPIDIWMPEKN